MKKFYLILFCLFNLSFLSTEAFASANDIYPCAAYNCANPYAQARDIAETKNPGEEFTILGGSNLDAVSYRVELGYRYGEPFMEPIQIPTIYEVQQAVYEIQQFRQAARNVHVEIPAGVAASAFDMVLVPSVINNVNAYVGNNLSLTNQLTAGAYNVLKVIGGNFVNFDFHPIIVTAVFADGTRQDFQLKRVSVDGVLIFEFIPGSGRTVENSSIPADPNKLIGTYNIGEESSQGFSNIAQMFGIQVSESAQCAPETKFQCIKDGEGKTVCTLTVKCK